MKKPSYGELEKRIAELETILAEKEHSEQALAESREKYANILEGIEEGYFEVNLRGDFTLVNKAMCKMVDRPMEELLGLNNRVYMDANTAKKVYSVFNQVFRTGKPGAILEYEITTSKGIKKNMALSAYLMRDNDGNPIGFRGLVRDHTERRKTEEKLQHLQKMEAIGTLAGGIAHDFNNILYPIIGYTELTMDEVPPESPARQYLENILISSKRAGDLVKQILDFSRPTQSDRKPILLKPLVKEAIKLLKASIPATIEIIVHTADDIPPVYADPTKIHQIIMNLCTNAYHAMEEQGGRLEIRLEEVTILPGEDVGIMESSPGRFARLTVQDTGKGMDHRILPNIFEPFFTTKASGKGTGLGLSTVYGIVQEYSGNITVSSLPGQGTTFQIHLPIMAETPSTGDLILAKNLPKGNEHVLIVDDEHIIVELEKKMLEQLGYEVTARTSSIEAFEAFCASPEKFDMVITDMTMPQMTGIQLARKLMEIKPNLPIILMTGFSKQFDQSAAMAMGIKGFLMKPVVKRVLAETIRNVLPK